MTGITDADVGTGKPALITGRRCLVIGAGGFWSDRRPERMGEHAQRNKVLLSGRRGIRLGGWGMHSRLPVQDGSRRVAREPHRPRNSPYA